MAGGAIIPSIHPPQARVVLLTLRGFADRAEAGVAGVPSRGFGVSRFASASSVASLGAATDAEECSAPLAFNACADGGSEMLDVDDMGETGGSSLTVDMGSSGRGSGDGCLRGVSGSIVGAFDDEASG